MIKNYAFMLLLLIPFGIYAQNTISGVVSDELGPLGGATVLVKGTQRGTVTDFNGNYQIEAEIGDVLVFSYIGYKNKEATVNGKTLNVAMEEDTTELEGVVVIGYGTVNKKDATGSVDLLTVEDLNKGGITTVDQMLAGRSSGVRIVNSGGQPDSAPNIRIRGGASLNANNSPLIIIDGIPISINNPAGQSNPLALVNPNDIESFSILKDASATAIYGSRASNGVIIITTKKGSSGEAKYNYSSNIQIGTLTNKLELFSSEEYERFINQFYPMQTDLLGVNGVVYNTDWQDEIYRTSYTTDHNFSVTANLFDKVPFRSSIGYSNIEGILKESALARYNASLSLAPRFIDNHLKVSINAKGIFTRKDQPDENAAIGSALTLNPTLPVFDPTDTLPFGGYYQALEPTDALRKTGPANAVAILKQRERNEKADRFLGNIELDYKFHFLPELRAIVNFALDYSESDIRERFLDNSIVAYNNFDSNPLFNIGESYSEIQQRQDRTMESYFNYTKFFTSGIISKVDAQAGYSYQNFRNNGTQFPTIIDDNGVRAPGNIFGYFNELNIQSFFGRLNLDFANKYLVTASYRADGSSLFAKDNRWGHFPSVALAWKISEEGFLKESKGVSDLKLRLGWGVTGQQDITGAAGFYPYTALYLNGDTTVQYAFENSFYTTYRAQPYNSNLTWEETRTSNAGIDFSFWNDFVAGNVDYYFRKTTNLLSVVPQSEGSLINRFISNIGNTESEGVEVGLNLNPVSSKDVNLSINGNVAFNETYVTDLNNVTQVPISGTGIGRGTGVNIGYFAVNERSRNFWLYEQLYDAEGRPIQEAFVDQNGDGIVNDSDRIFIPIDPKWTYGFGLFFNYKNLDLTANFRGQVGGAIFNANLVNRGFLGAGTVVPANGVGFINNILDLYDGTNYNGFTNAISDQQALSDFYVSDASFLRFDNVTLGYKFNNFFHEKLQVRIYGSINNIFVISEYEGLDPENYGGIEQNPYARPRTYTFGINIDF